MGPGPRRNSNAEWRLTKPPQPVEFEKSARGDQPISIGASTPTNVAVAQQAIAKIDRFPYARRHPAFAG